MLLPLKGRILKGYMHDGYPTVNVRGAKGIHVLMLEAFVGPRPPKNDGRHLNDIRHDNRLVNLAWGTRQENFDDAKRNGVKYGTKGGAAANRAKTHCAQGHPFNEKNTYWNKRGGRECRACRNIKSHTRREQLKSAGTPYRPVRKNPPDKEKARAARLIREAVTDPCGVVRGSNYPVGCTRTSGHLGRHMVRTPSDWWWWPQEGQPAERRARTPKTHCPSGHPFDEANTLVTKDGYRVCRTCKRLKSRARRSTT